MSDPHHEQVQLLMGQRSSTRTKKSQKESRSFRSTRSPLKAMMIGRRSFPFGILRTFSRAWCFLFFCFFPFASFQKVNSKKHKFQCCFCFQQWACFLSVQRMMYIFSLKHEGLLIFLEVINLKSSQNNHDKKQQVVFFQPLLPHLTCHGGSNGCDSGGTW